LNLTTISFIAVSRAPLGVLEAYRKRMGWNFKWVSSGGSDFNYDFHVLFARDDLAKGKVFYNYAMIDTSMRGTFPATAFSTRMPTAAFFTPIRATGAAPRR
jgi:predicted dithiol-disulfide oxidoreductase (DUF899 family)